MNSSCSTVSLDNTFLALSTLSLITTVISFLLNSFVFFLLHKSSSFHSNVRLLLKNFTFSVSLFSLFLFARNIYNFQVWRNGLYEMTPFFCESTEIGWLISTAAGTHSITFIGVERVVTSILNKKYVDFDRPSTIAYALTAASWLCGFGICAFILSISFFERDDLCLCNAFLALPVNVQYTLCPLIILVEICTIMCYSFLHRHSRSSYSNFTIDTNRHSLAERHQMIENMETTKLLAPTMLLHGTVYIWTELAITYVRVGVVDRSSSAKWAVFIYLVLALETSLHPIFLLVKHKKMRQTAVDYIPMLKRFLGSAKTSVTTVTPYPLSPADSSGGGKQGKYRSSRKISHGVVEFRVKPEQTLDILNSLWEMKPRH